MAMTRPGHGPGPARPRGRHTYETPPPRRGRGAAAPRSAHRGTLARMTTLRIGLLGTGPWARRVHAPALAAHPGVELAGIWGRRAAAAAALAQVHDSRPYDTPDALFADCDALAVALPPSVQAPLAIRAAAAGCHLLLDKPVATAVPEARALAAAADRAGIASVVFFTARFGAQEGSGSPPRPRPAAGSPRTPTGSARSSPRTAPARTRTRPGAGRRAACGTSARTRCPCSLRSSAMWKRSPRPGARPTRCC